VAGEPRLALSIDVVAAGMLAAVQISWAPSNVMIIASLLACSTSKPAVEAADSITASQPATPEPTTMEPEPATVEPEPAQPPAPSEPETSDECQIMLVLEADKGNLAGPVTLLARAKNLTANPLELTLADRCPGGEAHFSGLESQDGSYDYYHTCAMGACAGGRPPIVIALPPGELVDISSAQIDPTGKKPCNRPIATGTYNLSFSVSPAEGSNNPVLCGPEPLVLRRK
jgi:hypothetical protein